MTLRKLNKCLRVGNHTSHKAIVSPKTDGALHFEPSHNFSFGSANHARSRNSRALESTGMAMQLFRTHLHRSYWNHPGSGADRIRPAPCADTAGLRLFRILSCLRIV